MGKLSRSGEYRGYVWNSYADLSRQLGKSRGYVSMMLHRHPSWGIRELIDPPCKKQQACCGILYTTEKELSLKLGKGKDYIKDQKRNNPDMTLFDIVWNTLYYKQGS